MNLRIWGHYVCLFTLAACSGGGGGGGGGNPGPTVPPPTNSAPTISGAPVETVRASESYSFQPNATDSDADTLSFSIVNQPYWTAFDATTGELSGAPLAANIGEYADIVITVSDGVADVALPAFTLAVLPQQLGRANFVTEGDTFPTEDGYQSVGTLVLDTGTRQQRFEESDLMLKFAENGDLEDINGETVVPPTLSDNVMIETPTRAIVDMMSGAEIYADPDLGILLQPDTQYLVYYIRAGIDLIVTDPEDNSTELLELETPARGELLLIVDPTDPMFYHYASQPLFGERGYGNSLHGLIPFKPELPFEQLDSFNGHIIESGSWGLSIKNVDLFEVSGERVFRLPSLLDLDFDDPFNSPIEYRVGMNGQASLGLGVFGFGILDLSDAQMSGTIDVGLDRQSLAMQTIIEPADNWLPDWVPLKTEAEVSGEWFINGDGEYLVDMSGRYEMFVPAAKLEGSIRLENSGASMTATFGTDDRQFSMTSSFETDRMSGYVDIPDEFSAGLGTEIIAAVDREIAAAEEALAELEDAVADYEFEVSLRGLRSQLPRIADEAVAALESMPGKVQEEVRSSALSYMANTCLENVGCLDDVVDESSIAQGLSILGRNIAREHIRPIVGFMQDLKTQSQQADDASLRQALEDALRRAATFRVLNRRTTVTHDFGDPFGILGPAIGVVTLYNSTFSQRTMPDATADRLLQAADNIYRIGETDGIRISAQEIFDALPTEEVLDTVKQEVANGVALIPVIEGIEFTLFAAGFEAAVDVDGTQYPINFNFFDPDATAEGVSDLLAEQLIDAKN